MGECDHQTSNGEYDEDTSGFEDGRLSQSNDQAGDGQLQHNLNSDGNFIDDQEQVTIISLMKIVTFRLQNWKVVSMNLTSPWRNNFFTHDTLMKVMMFLMKNMCSG